MGRSLLFRSSTELPSNSRQGKYKSALMYSRTSKCDHLFKTPNFSRSEPSNDFELPQLLLCHISFFFRPLCFISPFPRFISSPRAAPAKVVSLLISPSAQSAMSPRSQGGCNCELQKKKMINSTTVVQNTQTEPGRLLNIEVGLSIGNQDVIC